MQTPTVIELHRLSPYAAFSPGLAPGLAPKGPVAAAPKPRP